MEVEFDMLQEVPGAQFPLSGGTSDPFQEDVEWALWFPVPAPGYQGAAYGK